MAGRATAKIAFTLVLDLATRLEAAGAPGCMPLLDDAVDLVWPLACRLAKLSKRGDSAGEAARRAREELLGRAVSMLSHPADPWTWPVLDPSAWHVQLVPGPAPDREREVA